MNQVEIKIFKDTELKIQRQLGRGSFGTVHLAHCDEPEVTNPVVMKVMHDSVATGDVPRKLFMKEVKLLASLHHENIVRMYGICVKPLAIILEYVVFDFKPFQRDLKVNIVDGVLSVIAQSEYDEYDHLIPAIASEITKGLSHLHELDVAHRDLKPANVLISNQHYSALQDKQQMNRIKAVRPVVCKLADFGESRSRLLQTNGLNNPGTNEGFRGTIAFMAPEILLPERMDQGKKFSLDDLKKVDIWALGLVFYCLINPGVSHPYERDATDLPDIYMMLRQRQRPSANPQYQTKQATVWSRVKVAFEACADYDPTQRAKASDVLAVLRGPGLVTNEPPLRQASAGKRHVGAAVQMRGNPARMTAVQWYAGEQGEAALKYVFDKFTSIADSEVKMSRKTDTHVDQDVTLSFKRHGQEWHVTFLYNFPRSNASLMTTSGGDCISIGGDTIETAVRAIINRISSPDMRGNVAPKMAIQWYLGEEGESALKYIFDELRRIADGEVKMSRKTDTQDLTLSFEHEENEWQVKFSSNFPRSNASLSTNGEIYAMVGGDTMETAVNAIINSISSSAHQPHAQMGDNPAHMAAVQWYAGEEGEADLKYIVDELESIADGEVKMSRKTDTQDLTLRFQCQGQGWEVKFPSNFPRSNAGLSINGEIRAMIGGDTVENAVSAMVNRISLASACGNAAR